MPKQTSHTRHLSPPLICVVLLALLATALAWVSLRPINPGRALTTETEATNSLVTEARELQCAALGDTTAQTTCRAIRQDNPKLCAELTTTDASNACRDEVYAARAEISGDPANCKFISKQVLRTKCNTRIGTN